MDTEKKCFIQDVELKKQISNSRPHSDWLRQKVSLKYLSVILETDPCNTCPPDDVDDYLPLDLTLHTTYIYIPPY